MLRSAGPIRVTAYISLVVAAANIGNRFISMAWRSSADTNSHLVDNLHGKLCGISQCQNSSCVICDAMNRCQLQGLRNYADTSTFADVSYLRADVETIYLYKNVLNTSRNAVIGRC